MCFIKSPSRTGVAYLLALGFAAPAFGYTEEYPLPRLQPSCAAECADFKPATPIFKPEPELRSDLLGNTTTYIPQGLVMLRFTVGTDGKVHDIVPVFQLGHYKIAERAIESMQTWTYAPATLKGKPVPQMLTYRIFLQPDWFHHSAGSAFRPGPKFVPTHPEFDMAAVDRLIAEGKRDEATALLREGAARPRPSDAMIGAIYQRLVRLANERGDTLEARHDAVLATIAENRNVVTKDGAELWTARLNADLAVGEIADAVLASEKLNIYAPNPAADARIKDAIAKADAAPELLTKAAIPSDKNAPSYWHALRRNTFKFAEGSGQPHKFAMMCDNNMMEAQVTFTAQYRLPPTWRNCTLFVSGPPGTTFGIIETQT